MVYFGKMNPLRKLYHERWNVGVVDQTAADLVSCGLKRPIRWLSTLPRDMMFADPGYLEYPDGRRTVFVEAARCRDGLGQIWQAELQPGSDPAKARFVPLLSSPCHMSYPRPFLDEDGTALLTYESWQSRRVNLLRQADGQWQSVAALLPGRPVIDPTLWKGAEGWFLFCSFRDEGPDSRLHLFFADALHGPWTPHPGNPIVDDPGRARPAGPLFVADGRLVRPSQDCSATYGGALQLNWVRVLTRDAYVEEPIRRIAPPAGPFACGLHTLCPAGDVTWVDGKSWQFGWTELATRIPRRWQERQRLRSPAPAM